MSPPTHRSIATGFILANADLGQLSKADLSSTSISWQLGLPAAPTGWPGLERLREDPVCQHASKLNGNRSRSTLGPILAAHPVNETRQLVVIQQRRVRMPWHSPHWSLHSNWTGIGSVQQRVPRFWSLRQGRALPVFSFVDLGARNLDRSGGGLSVLRILRHSNTASQLHECTVHDGRGSDECSQLRPRSFRRCPGSGRSTARIARTETRRRTLSPASAGPIAK